MRAFETRAQAQRRRERNGRNRALQVLAGLPAFALLANYTVAALQDLDRRWLDSTSPIIPEFVVLALVLAALYPLLAGAFFLRWHWPRIGVTVLALPGLVCAVYTFILGADNVHLSRESSATGVEYGLEPAPWVLMLVALFAGAVALTLAARVWHANVLVWLASRSGESPKATRKPQ